MARSGSSSLLLGDMGEDKFKSWCSLSGALATKASPDRMGWDYFVELDPVRNPHRPLDSQGWLPKFFVQVKSTRSIRKNVKIKLSAIKRLVDTDLPAFVVVVVFGENGVCIDSYCIHIDNLIVSDVLETVRRIESMGDTAINNKFYVLNFNLDYRIRLDDAQSFEILRSLAGVYDYSLNKSSFRKSVGYDADSIKANFRFDKSIKHSDIQDMFIGISGGLRIESFSISRERFGIPLPNDVEVFGGAVLKMKPRSANWGVTRVSRPSDGIFYDLNCQVLVAPFNYPSEGIKVRVFNEQINIIVDTKTQEFLFDLKDEENEFIDISEFRDFINFMNLLSEESSFLEILIGGKIFMTGSSISGIGRPCFAENGIYLIDALEWAAKNSGFRDKIFININLLNKILTEKHDFISLMKGQSFSLNCEIEENRSLKMDSHAVLMISDKIQIGNLNFHVTLATVADVDFNGGQFIKFSSNGMDRLDGFINDNLAENSDLLNRRLEKLCENKYVGVPFLVRVTADQFGAESR